MEHKASFKYKAGSNTVVTHSDTKRNIPRGLFFAVTHLYSTYSTNKQAEQLIVDIKYTELRGKISNFLYINDLKLLGRNEDNLENEIKIMKAISKDINMNFGLEKHAKICLNKGEVQNNIYIYIYLGNTFEKDIIELDPRKASKYLGIEESHDIEHKNEKDKLKKEYVRRLRLVLGTDLSPKNKFKQMDHWQYQYFDIVLELLPGAKKNCKN